MRIAARAAMEERSFAQAFAQLWELYTDSPQTAAPAPPVPFNFDLHLEALAS